MTVLLSFIMYNVLYGDVLLYIHSCVLWSVTMKMMMMMMMMMMIY